MMAKKLNKGLTALKKERPDVVASMGFKKGGMKKKGFAPGGQVEAGVKVRGTGAATKGLFARGPMG
jgi:hypothetical protein